jgi:hypothetical protein
MSETQFWLGGMGWGMGGAVGSGLAPPMPAVAKAVAGTEPERSGGGVRHMLNRVSS